MPADVKPSDELLQFVLVHTADEVHTLLAHDLSSILNCLVRFGCTIPHKYRRVSEIRFEQKLEDFTPAMLCRTLWSLVKSEETSSDGTSRMTSVSLELGIGRAKRS